MKLFSTTLNNDIKSGLSELIDSGLISAGKRVDLFESLLNKQLGLINPVTVNSGTSALHLALVNAGVKEGDEIITTAQTFIATGLSILYQKAKPIFVDISYETGNIDVTKIEEKITNKTRVILIIHWGGYPCDMDEITSIAKKHNLIVIEDAAHAIGSNYKDRPIGSISDYTCFSFQSIKHLTTGDGGAVCSLTKENERKLKKLRWFGIDRDLDMAGELGEREYNLQNYGYKYHMNDIAATFGIFNLKIFDEKMKRIRNIAEVYNKNLSNIDGIQLFNYKNDRTSAYWLYGFHVKDRRNFVKKLRNSGIECSVVHMGIDKNDIFGGINNKLVNQRKFDSTQINIPINYDLTNEDVNYVIETIKNGW
jgi:perosamine synthetase